MLQRKIRGALTGIRLTCIRLTCTRLTCTRLTCNRWVWIGWLSSNTGLHQHVIAERERNPMRYILNVGYLVLFACYLPVLFLQKKFQGKRRPGIWHKFMGVVPACSRKTGTSLASDEQVEEHGCIVFHAVSLGEVNAIRQLVLNYQAANPQKKIVVSTTTQTGLEAAQKAFPELTVCLLPFDFTWAVNRFLNTLRPEKLVLAELEIWPNLLSECRRRGIQTCLVNGRLSEKSYLKYRRFRFVFRSVFANLDLVCVQHADYRERFAKIGVPSDRIRVLGNLKYDSLLLSRDEPQAREFRELLKTRTQDVVFLAGSTQAPEELLAIEAYLRLREQFPHLRLVICPRHPERFDAVAELLKSRNVPFRRRSQIAESQKGDNDQNVLIDSVGELRYWWAVADVAFVGGSFGNRGGQNMMEPAALGAAVCFGPNTHNFTQEVQWLTRDNAAVQLQTDSDLAEFLERCLAEPGYRNTLGQNARRTVLSLLGGVQTVYEKTIDALGEIDSISHQSSRAA